MKRSIFVVFGIASLLFGICNLCFAEFQKGPYLQYVVNLSDGRVETDRIKILWKIDSTTGATTGEVHYKESTAAGYVAPGTGWPTDGITDRFHEVLVTGLAPGTKYDYKVQAGSLESAEFTFTTPTTEDDHQFSFVVFGDVQCQSEECRKRRAAVVKLIDSISPKPDFLVSVGDMWWDNDGPDVQTFFDVDQGTDDVWTDPDITISVTEIPRLLQNYPLFPTYGNHEDRNQNGTNRFTDYFVIPATLTTNEADAYYSFNYGNSYFLVINTELDCSSIEGCTISGDQLTEVTDDLSLAASTSDNIFVFLHRGVHSNGARHGSEENPRLSQVLGPLFRDNNVDVVFQGHDHVYERFKPDTTSGYPYDPPNIHLIEEGVTYIVTGAGGALEDVSNDVPPAPATEGDPDVEHPLTSAVSERTLEAIHVQVSGDQVYVRVVTVDEGLFGASADLDDDGTSAESSYLLDHFFVRPTTVTATRGLQWLRDNQNSDGSWYNNPAVTCLGALAFLNAGYTENDPRDPVVGDAIEYITGFIQGDGSITAGSYPNYETSICILPLVATYDSGYDTIIGDAKDYLLSIQNTEANGYDPSDLDDYLVYGGWGYPTTDWADLSNTQWTLMGLHFAYDALGLSSEGEDWVDKALTWVRHCQNDTTINDLTGLSGFPGTDGGLTYNPMGVGPLNTVGITTESWGSMTYASIWSYALLGLDESSDEIGAAIGWVESNYSVDHNPPLQTYQDPGACYNDPSSTPSGNFALYYYYVTMAKALAMLDVNDISGHLWKEELTAKLIELQKTDWSWENTCTREWEGVPELSTAYSILALQAFQDPPTNLWVEVILESPADLVVYDPQERSCSNKDGCNIPGATFEVDAAGHQTVTLPELESGHYRFEMIGTGNGLVHLTVNGYRGEELISTKEMVFEIKKFEVWEADLLVSSVVGPLTLDIVEESELAYCYPVADAGQDQNVYADEDCIASVTLDGSDSKDFDDDIVSFKWYDDGTFLKSGDTITAEFPLGMHLVTIEVTDSLGNTNSDEVIINVVDNTPPEISVSVSPDTLWPPNHEMVPVIATVSVSDNCDVDPDVALVSVVSSEPDDAEGGGDGKTINDIQGADIGDEDYNISLRAERQGKGDGRIYTITYKATDDSGNSATSSTTVTVPHNQ